MGPRELVVRRFLEFTNEYPWAWTAAHLDEWPVRLTAERHLAVSTVRGYQGALRLFTEFLTDGRYGWAAACAEAFGPGSYPVAIAHEWNTISHLRAMRAGRRRARSPAMSCSGSSITPMIRWSGSRGRSARALPG